MTTDLVAAQDELTRKVMDRPGVTGTAIGEHRGAPCLKVYVESREAGRGLPTSVRGVPVVVEVTGAFRRL